MLLEYTRQSRTTETLSGIRPATEKKELLGSEGVGSRDSERWIAVFKEEKV